MNLDSFKKSVLFLSLEEKCQLIQYIKDTITPEVLTGEDRYLFLVTMAESVLKTRLTDKRTSRNTLIRAFVAHRLAGEGYSTTRIGKFMGRDHSSVTHQIRRLDEMLSLPKVYHKEITAYREFEALL